MKICIVGVGAIGGLIGTRLAVAGRDEVCALARGATLAALRQHGWRLQTADGPMQAPARAAEDPGELGVQDLVVIAVKGPALGDLAPRLAPLIGPHTLLLPAMNGVPWWFCAGLPGFEAPLASVDPGGRIGAALPLPQVLGCVVHMSASTPQAGEVAHRTGRRMYVGEPFGPAGERVTRVTQVLGEAGFDAVASDDLRYEAWYKLWGNLTMNPVSAITGATIDRVLADPLVRAFCTQAMHEAAAIGARIGCAIEQGPEDRHAVTSRLGAFKTSMLQDVEAGRALELDAIVGAVQEIGRRLDLATPGIDALFGLARLFARTRGLYPDA